MLSKVLCLKSKTYMKVYVNVYSDFRSVVEDIQDKTFGKKENDNKALKFIYLIISVITNRLSKIDRYFK